MLLVASGTLSLLPRFSFYRPVTTTKSLKLESASAFVPRDVQCRMIIACTHMYTHTHRKTQLYYIILILYTIYIYIQRLCSVPETDF